MNLPLAEDKKIYKVVAFLAREHGLNALCALLANSSYQIECIFTHALNPKSEDAARSERSDFAKFVELADRAQIPLIKVDSLEESRQIDAVLDSISDLDFIVSVSWRRLIPQRHLDRPRFGSVNLHRGKLPEYAGAEPIQQAIGKGETDICITAHFMTEVIDGGETIAIAHHPFAYQNDKSLEENISKIKEDITDLFGPLLMDSLQKMKVQENLKYVFVDFDGTLIDSVGCLYQSYFQLLKEYGVEGRKQEFDTLNGPSSLEIVEILIDKHSLKVELSEMHARYLELIKSNYLTAKAFLDAEMFLSSLHQRGLLLILVTSNRQEICLPLIEKWQWKKYFRDFVWGESVTKAKPEPDIYLEAFRKSRAHKAEVLVIEDSLNGVRAARAAGLAVWGLSLDFSKEDLKKAGALRVFRNLSDGLEELLLYRQAK
jgi:HAD superfamily hydrolase (TIGR01509 family)